MGTPAKLPLPTLAGHVWDKGRYKIGGARVNERCIPAHFVLAIVVAEACDWCERKIQSSKFTLRDGVEAALGFVRLRSRMSANKEVRRAKFFFVMNISQGSFCLGRHTRSYVAEGPETLAGQRLASEFDGKERLTVKNVRIVRSTCTYGMIHV